MGILGGEGVRQRPKRKKRAKKARKSDGAVAKDYSETTIVTESKPGDKYVVSSVPFPYTSAEQYEAALATPLGKEWNARLAFDNLTRPEVIVRAGVYLEPMAYVKPEDDDNGKNDDDAKAGTKGTKQQQKKKAPKGKGGGGAPRKSKEKHGVGSSSSGAPSVSGKSKKRIPKNLE